MKKMHSSAHRTSPELHALGSSAHGSVGDLRNSFGPSSSSGALVEAGPDEYVVGPFKIRSLHFETTTTTRLPKSGDDLLLYLPRSGLMEIMRGAHRFTAGPKTALVTNISQVEQITTYKNRSHLVITCEKSAVVDMLSEMIDAPAPKLDIFGTLEIDSGPGACLHDLTNLLWSTLATHDGCSGTSAFPPHLFRAAFSLVLERVPHNYSERLNRTRSPAMPRHLKKATEYMLENMSTAISITEVAKAAGVSERALQLAFQQFKGTTPFAYLRELRLERVRNLLADKDNQLSISEAARAFGFTHMGRFSEAYRKAFGVVPSETMERLKPKLRK